MKKKAPRFLTLWLILLCVFITGLLFYTRCRIECMKIGYKINNEKARYTTLDARRNELIVELKALKSPEQIERQIVRYKLELKMPTPKQVIDIP